MGAITMMPKRQPRAIDAPYILRLIRDRKFRSIQDVFDHYGLEAIKEATFEIDQDVNLIYGILLTLHDAGLITMDADGESIAPTPLIEKVQRALQISLSKLSGQRPNSILVTPIFRRHRMREDEPQVFVLMPFAKSLEPVYERHIRGVCGGLHLSVARADDIYHAEMIMNDVFSKIYSAQIVVADCTGRNPNVFYEIGIAHTVGKPVVLLTQSVQDVPFDLRHIRFIEYTQTPEGLVEFERALARTLETEVAKLTRGEERDRPPLSVDDYQLP
jgi:hypothetical protein